MAEPLHTVAFTAGFLSQAKAEGLSWAELERLVDLLSADPDAGELIVGSGGCRKVRLAGRGKGRSGGYRVVTFLPSRTMPVYAFAVLSKGARENFSDAEVAAMAAMAKRIKAGARPLAVK